MRTRCFALTVATLIGLVVLTASATASTDLWSGVWNYTADGGVTSSRLHIQLHHDHQTLTGHYTGMTNGTIGGELNRDFGRVWCGRFRDTSGTNHNKGKFCATIQSDAVSFAGWYKPCIVFCRSHTWSGEKS